jgi:carbon monoxide dehydrogenase subunit G
MHFSEQIEVPLPVDAAWSFVWQVDQTAACLPGCVGVTEIEAGHLYRARIEDRVGPYKIGFDLDVVIEEAEPPNRIRLTASGVDKTLGATQRIAMTVELHEVEPSRTRLDVEADVEVLGKIAALGQFVVKRKAQEIVRKFAQNLEEALQRAAPSANVAGDS